MEKIREQAVTKLGELKKIKPHVYTSLELHPSRQMMGRVQRREEMRYHQEVQKQKGKLKKDISDIDTYLGRVRMQKENRVRMGNGKNGTPLEIPKVLPAQGLSAPNIVFGPKPRMVETRLHRQRRRGRF